MEITQDIGYEVWQSFSLTTEVLTVLDRRPVAAEEIVFPTDST